MRSLVSRALLLVALITPSYALDKEHKLNTVEDVLSENKGGPKHAGAAAGSPNSEAISDESTTFNGVKVPPMKELTGDDFDKDVKIGYWYSIYLSLLERTQTDGQLLRFVKHYSPYCHHCIAIAPTWQTLYEFYYVSRLSCLQLQGV